MNLELVTDLTKIGLEIKVVTDPMESWLSYNLICIPLTKNNKLVGKDDSTIEIALSNQKYDDFSQVDNFMENDDVDWLQQI